MKRGALRRLKPPILVLWMAFALTPPAAASTPETPGQPSFFGSTEVRRENLAPFPKWTGMLERRLAEQAAGARDCRRGPVNACNLSELQDFLRRQRGRPVEEQIRAVNTFMNRRPYIVDMVNWGVEDYWASPGEFIEKDGDCEDYAIAKFFALRSLGHEELDLRVAVVQDLNLKVAHAVLVVRLDRRILVLDNQISQVVEEKLIRHYRPVYSISERHWWLHRQP
ncbi:MAG: transglutaminase-like cysteine peptidase [Alphaproteobacteria bacterium]|nr:transglutaminase-like cysteine peptidase [Alphaproteobacteria bacterium]